MTPLSVAKCLANLADVMTYYAARCRHLRASGGGAGPGRVKPSADFCSAVRLPFDSLSRRSDTEQSSWGNLSRLPGTVVGSTLRTLDRYGLRGKSPARPSLARLISGICPSTRTFNPCFLQTPPRDGSPCIITSPYLHQVGQRAFTSKLLSMTSTRRSRYRGSITGRSHFVRTIAKQPTRG